MSTSWWLYKQIQFAPLPHFCCELLETCAKMFMWFVYPRPHLLIKFSREWGPRKTGTYLWGWCSGLGSPLAGMSARDNCPWGERLPGAGPGPCWEEGLVSGHKEGCSGFHHLGGWLWLSLWPVETLQPHYSRVAQPLLREPWGNKTEWIWG